MSIEFGSFSKARQMAKKNDRKMTPEEKARQLENQRRLEEVIELRLEKDGMTREDILRMLGRSA